MPGLADLPVEDGVARADGVESRVHTDIGGMERPTVLIAERRTRLPGDEVAGCKSMIRSFPWRPGSRLSFPSAGRQVSSALAPMHLTLCRRDETLEAQEDGRVVLDVYPKHGVVQLFDRRST